jgi:hypothetical protein
MSLYKYVGWAAALLRELEESLSMDDRTALRSDLDTLGPGNWSAWIAAHSEEIEKYACATSTMRAKRTTWQDPVHRRRLTLAAMYIHDKARHTLAQLDEFPLTSGTGPSHRDMSLYASLLFDRLRRQEIPAWPFDRNGDCTYS